MLDPAELVCDSNPKWSRERFKQKISRKYVYYGPLGQDVVSRPVVIVMETLDKDSEPDRAYERGKNEESWMRVLCASVGSAKLTSHESPT